MMFFYITVSAKRKIDSKLEKKLKKLRVGVKHRRRVTSIGNKDSIDTGFFWGILLMERKSKSVSALVLFLPKSCETHGT